MTLKKLYKKAVKTLEFQRLLAFCCQTRDYISFLLPQQVSSHNKTGPRSEALSIPYGLFNS